MKTVLLAFFFLAILLVLSRLIAGYLRVVDEGEPHSEELFRDGVTLRALLDGRVPPPPSGGVVPMREGLVLEASADALDVRGTRTVARDVF